MGYHETNQASQDTISHACMAGLRTRSIFNLVLEIFASSSLSSKNFIFRFGKNDRVRSPGLYRSQ